MTTLERIASWNEEAERNASMDSGWSLQRCHDIASAKSRILDELTPKLQALANVAESLRQYTGGPSQHWPKDAIRAAAAQLVEEFEAAGVPPKRIEDGCAF